MSEEKEPIINGIDVSESVLTATNNDVYYSQNAVDELQNNIKRLQEENEGLKSLNDFNVQKIEVLQEENEKLKEEKDGMQIVINNYIEHTTKYRQALEEINILAKNYCNACDEFKAKTYKALEEIRKVLEYYANSWVNPLQYPDLHYNSKKAKDALLKVDEVLNDRN